MTEPTIHSTFTIEREYPVPPSRVFEAFADPDLKAVWFQSPPEWGPDEKTMDFRVGGKETSVGGPPGGFVSRFEATYHDIVEDERIVYAYEMDVDGRRISVSLTTVLLEAVEGGTRFQLIEQGAYFEGGEGAANGRVEGTEAIIANVDKLLAQ